MRLFLAIELPDPARKHLADLCGALRRLSVSIVPPQNLHITLKFLGEVEETAVPTLCDALRTTPVAETAQVRSEVVELLPPRGPVRVVAVGLGGEVGKLLQLHQAVEERCDAQGFPPESRRYLPHVTLARARDPLSVRARDELPELLSKHLPGPPFDVTGFTLFESRLGGGPPEYIRLARFPA
jgi:2'-5' RNA ligase